MNTQHARPLDEKRDKSVPARCLGFGWLRLANGEPVGFRLAYLAPSPSAG